MKTSKLIFWPKSIVFSLATIFCFGVAVKICPQTSANEVFTKTSGAVVLIKTDKGAGTGFVVNSSGVIATAFHVVDGVSKVAIKTASGDVYDSVSLLAKDERKDLALLKIKGFDLFCGKLGNSNDVKPGDKVIVIGNPLGIDKLQATISDGMISGVRDLDEGYKVIQMTAPVSPGSSGGPALAANGDIIGVVVFKLTAGESLNFAVPINYVRGMMENLDTSKTIQEWSNEKGTGSLFAEKSVSKSGRWKSLASGTTKIVRFEGDYIYVETVLPEELKKAGGFSIGELKKEGDKYVGTLRDQVLNYHPPGNFVWQQARWERCTMEYRYEFTSVKSDRIEGRILDAPRDAKLDWKKCTFSKKLEWLTFVWIPE